MVVTACDRLDLLERTLRSFWKYNTYPIKEVFIRDDSGLQSVWDDTFYLVHSISQRPTSFDYPPEQIGQGASIDRLMRMVETPVVFHCEDDWEFTGDFLTQAMKVLDEGVSQVRGRHKDDRIDGVFKFSEPYEKNGVMVREVLDNHLFSWNPHVRMVTDQKFERENETTLGDWVKQSGKKTLWLEDSFYRHIGWDKTTNRHGTTYQAGVRKA